MYTILKLGTDTEIFLNDKITGQPVPACGLIGGTKKEPRPIDDRGSALQEDNVMLEFNTPPAENAEQWVSGINKVLAHVIDELKEKNLVINISPSVEFKPEQLKSQQAKEMGCEPDYSAWSLEQNSTMNHRIMQNVRTSGGHIHVSFMVDGQLPSRINMINLIRMMDLTLGVPSVLLDNDDRRRSFYGRPGAHRIKDENRVEYRALSNFWIRNDRLKRWAFDNTIEAIRRLNSHGSALNTSLWGEHLREDIHNCLKDSNKDIAERLVSTHGVKLP